VANLKDYLPQFSSIEEFRDALEKILSRDYADGLLSLTAGQEAEIREICRTKFSTWEWNFGHSPKASFKQSRRLPCGTVEAGCDIVHGRITRLVFSGDFLGGLPASGLAAALEGCRFDRAAVLNALRPLDVAAYFDSTTPSLLADLFFPE
jgi:lipoate-protein ligase A